MKGRILLLLLPALLLPGSLSCVKEEGTGTPKPCVEALASAGICADGALRVRFSEEAAERIERGESDIPTLGRIFPEAGEYEPRTRREGLHRWYYVSPEVRTKSDGGGLADAEVVEEAPRCVPLGFFNDPLLDRQWHYVNEGRLGGAQGIDIRIEPVWRAFTTGRPEVVVAVVDGGIDPAHEDLADNLWLDASYNFIDKNTTLVAHTHGTHIAGTIGAVNGNGLGVCGIAGGDASQGRKGVRLMSCQVYKTIIKDGKQVDTSAHIARAIKWAADHGAVICNNSWGYYYDDDGDGKLDDKELAKAMKGQVSLLDKDAIDYFIKYAGCDNDGRQLPSSPMKGGLVLFAAGNYGIANGAPANYAPVLAVGAADSLGRRADFSNYGPWVDIYAPGTRIASTSLRNRYSFLSGSSMACAVVSGVAALAVSHFGGPGYTPEQLKDRLLGGSKPMAPGEEGVRIDAEGAFSFDLPRDIPVWPNPVRETLQMDYGVPRAEGRVTLYSTAGKCLRECRVAADDTGVARLDMKKYAPGRYLLTLRQGGRDVRKTLVKR